MKNKDFQPKAGFTLVELLVVIAITAVLVAISATMIFRFRNTGDKVVATNNLRQIQMANISYAAENGGRFVPPRQQVTDGDGTVIDTYLWYENPKFISELKGDSATYNNGGEPDTSLDISLMDPAVVRAKPPGYTFLAASYGYTIPPDGGSIRQAQLDDSSRSAAFITADAPFADYENQGNIADRHNNKAIVVYYDGHASALSLREILAKAESDIFWSPVPGAPDPAP